jgi:hypothetical protein
VVERIRDWYDAGKHDMWNPVLDFEQHVYLLDVNDPSSAAQLRDDWHPLRHAVVIRYDYQPAYGEVEILNYDEIFSVSHPYPRAAELETACKVRAEQFFHLIGVGEPLDVMHWVSMHQHQVSLGELLELELPRKLRSYLADGQPIPAPSLLDCGAAIMAAVVGARLEAMHPPCANVYDGAAIWAHYHGKRFRTQFERARYRVECETLLPARLAPFCTESLLLELLHWNGLSTWLTAYARNGLAADYRAFRRLFPDATYAPDAWFEVPCTDVGPVLAAALPIYPKGVVRLPCYGPALLAWLQQRWLIQRDTIYARQREVVLPKAVLLSVDEQARNLYRHYHDLHYAPRPPDVLKEERVRRAYVGAGGARIVCEGPKTHELVPDIEELWSMLPPCVSAARTMRHFPKFHHRKTMALIMWHGGVAEQSIMDLLEWLPDPLNDEERRKKAATPQHLIDERRGHINGLLNAPGVHAWKPMCKGIIKNTLSNAEHQVHCPFVGPVRRLRAARGEPQLDEKGLRIACSFACNDDNLFGGSPAHLVEKALQRRRRGEEQLRVVRKECSRWSEGIEDTLDRPLKARDEEDEESSE